MSTITDEEIADFAVEMVGESIRDLIHERMGQCEQLGDRFEGFGELSEEEQDAVCERLEGALQVILDALLAEADIVAEETQPTGSLSFQRIQAALTAMGIGDHETVTRITVEPRRVVVVRHALGDVGAPHLDLITDDVAVTTEVFAVDYAEKSGQ